MKAWSTLAVALVGLWTSPAMGASLPATVVSAPLRNAGTVPQLFDLPATVEAPSKLERFMFFTPRDRMGAVDRLAREVQRLRGGSLRSYERFMRARWHDFETIVARYGMPENDVVTARAFAIVAGYKAYNGDHLSDVTSGTIFRTMVAVQTAAPQWNAPWSDARKQDLYVTWGLQGALLNWLDDDARRRGDVAQKAAVRAEARSYLQRQLGRSPDSVRLDRFACMIFRDHDCSALIRQLRADFETPSVNAEP